MQWIIHMTSFCLFGFLIPWQWHSGVQWLAPAVPRIGALRPIWCHEKDFGLLEPDLCEGPFDEF